MQKIKKGDKVIVLAGKDKGKQGLIAKVCFAPAVYPKLAIKVVVEGINLVKKHKKGDPQKNESGGIISKAMPIAISNVALLNPKTNKADKVGFKFIEAGKVQKKVRYFKSNQEVIDV
jgi:large subunit ribosomal protein L24